MVRTNRICDKRDKMRTKPICLRIDEMLDELNTSIDGMQGYKQIEKSDIIKQQQEFIWLLKG